MSYNWVPFSTYSMIPSNAVVAGEDIDGTTIYVGRAEHNGEFNPAKVIPSKQVAYIPYGGEEIQTSDYQILVGDGLTWVEASDGQVPAEAVSTGTSNGEPLYVGRAKIDGSLMTGKIHPSHNCIYVPYGGAEHKFSDYEVLVVSHQPIWLPSSVNSGLPDGAILAGHDQDQSPMYIGRAWHDGDQLPAKVLPTKNECYVCHSGREICVENYDVLCNGRISWVRSYPSTRSVPPFAVAGGVTADGEPLYIGRVEHEGSLTVGKVQISHGVCYIPFAGAEVSIDSEIEVLCEG